jgi:endonuclease/exonuclease/phosphatase family metal-dependent hydrolase
MLKTTMAGVALGAMAATTLITKVPAEAAYTAPRRVHTVAVTPTALKVAWRPVAGARAYRLQVSPWSSMRPASYLDVNRAAGTVRGLAPRQRYFYRVSVLDPATGRRVSPYSPTPRSAVTRGVKIPQGLQVTATTDTSATLSWTAPVGATYYRVATSTSPTFASQVDYTRATGPAATVTGLLPDTTYYFRVQVVRASGAVLTPFGPVDSARTEDALPVTFPADGPVDVRVGSFNVMTVSGDRTEGERLPWAKRRATVIKQILGEKVDVLGVQEVNQSLVFKDRLVDGETQIEDLKNGLNAAGGHFAVTNETPYNCLNPTTTYKCVPKYRGASGGDRIYYNTTTLDLVSQGSYKYQHQNQVVPVNYWLVYAVFQVKKTGARFLFTNTHLDPPSPEVRLAQWRELMAKVDELKKGLPVVSVGDFNTQKMDPIIAPMLTAMKAHGYGDVLNQSYKVNPVEKPRAQHTINGWINTANHLDRDISKHGYPYNRAKTGNMIDWIFATNSLPVKEFKVVVDYDPATLMLRGVFPSDHNMIRATLTLP